MTPDDIKQTLDRHEKELERIDKEMEQLKKEEPVFDKAERPKLRKLFWANLVYLGVLIVGSVCLSMHFLAEPPNLRVCVFLPMLLDCWVVPLPRRCHA